MPSVPPAELVAKKTRRPPGRSSPPVLWRVSERPSVADIKLYIVMRGFITGVYDHIPKTVFSEYPKLMKLYQSVEKQPKVAEWVGRQGN
jgi:glutathione S-transferase